MSNELIKQRIEAGANRKQAGHPNKNQTTKHPVSGKRGVPTRG